MIMATTRRTWINPPKVELVTRPSSQRTTRMIAIVINIGFVLSVGFVWPEVDDARSDPFDSMRSCFFDMISGMFYITAEATDGAAARADDGEQCRSDDQQHNSFR